MARHKGGRKRNYKRNGRGTVTKMYQEYCRSMYRQSKVPSASGQWQSVENLSENIANVYRCMMQRLGAV